MDFKIFVGDWDSFTVFSIVSYVKNTMGSWKPPVVSASLFGDAMGSQALCNPHNDGAISDKQQLVLSKIAFAGAGVGAKMSLSKGGHI